jgi:hypothetical protein
MRALLATILLLVITCAKAQVITQELNTNRTGRQAFPRIIYDNSQALFLRYLELNFGQNNIAYKEVSKNNLSIISSNQYGLPSSQNDSIYNLFFREDGENFPKYFAKYDAPKLYFYRLAENSGRVIDTLFVHTFPKYFPQNGITADFHKGKLYFFYINQVTPFQLGDTSRIIVFDTLGNSLNSRSYTWRDPSKSQLPIRFMQMQKYPPNKDIILMAEMLFGDMNLYLINRTSLDTVRTIKPPFSFFFDRRYEGPDPNSFTADQSGFQYSGYVEMREIQGTRFVYNEQAFVYRANWQGDSLELRNFGDPNIDERSYAYQYSPENNQSFISTSTPWNDFRIDGAENREVVIYRWNKFGEDSIVLFGQSNHVATDIFADDNGDLFVVGTRNNWQGNDENFVWIAKIPNFAISLIEDRKMEARLKLYPNPAQDFLQIDHWPEGWPNTVNYKIIGLGAQNVQVGTLTQNQRLSISSLKPSTYILQLSHKGEQQNILWNKQ